MSNVTVSVIESGQFPRPVTLPAGSTVADLSRRLGKDGADRLPVMDENGQTLQPTARLYDGMSIAYSFKVAGA